MFQRVWDLIPCKQHLRVFEQLPGTGIKKPKRNEGWKSPKAPPKFLFRWNLRLDDVPQRMVLLVDGEQAGVGHLGVLVDGDPGEIVGYRDISDPRGTGGKGPGSLPPAPRGLIRF